MVNQSIGKVVKVTLEQAPRGNLSTREIAQLVHSCEWATADQIRRTRQALWRLERRGLVEAFGFFTTWSLVEKP